MAKMTTDKAREILTARGLDTHAQALDAIVELDVQKWGEEERASSRKTRGTLSHVLIVGAIATHAVEETGKVDRALLDAARAIATPADHAALRVGG